MQFAQKEKLILRNENGFGSIVKLSGARRKPFGVRITTGWKDGKQVRKYLGYYKTQQEALVALAEYHKSGGDFDLSKITLEELYQRWFKRVEDTASKSVLNTINMTHTRFGLLANKKLKDIKPDHLQDWMDAIDLKPGSKQKLKSVLTQMYEYAVKNDLITKNYASFIEVKGKTEKTGAIFTDEEIAHLWSKSDDAAIQDILILIYTGMRISELFDLDKESINMDERYAIGGSKTEAGKNRVIPFHDKIFTFIQDRMQNQNYIVQNETGGKTKYRPWQYNFQKLMDEFGWKHKIHDTRKTAISLMHRYEVPMETIRIIVGHSGKGVTEQVYLFKEPYELVEEVNKIQI